MLSHFERQSLIVNESVPHTSRRLLTWSIGTGSETASGHVASNLLPVLGGSLKTVLSLARRGESCKQR